ncbi:MAG: VOC family protein [Bacillus sp. (in: firmicutes)]
MAKGMIHHVELYVSDLEESVGFWGWLLEEEFGYQPFQSFHGGRSWKCGDMYLVFCQTAEKYLEVPYHRCRTGLNHIAFHGDSKEQIDSITEKLKMKGIPVLYQDKHPHAGGRGHYAVYFEDPDRIKVEIAAPSDDGEKGK